MLAMISVWVFKKLSLKTRTNPGFYLFDQKSVGFVRESFRISAFLMAVLGTYLLSLFSCGLGCSCGSSRFYIKKYFSVVTKIWEGLFVCLVFSTVAYFLRILSYWNVFSCFSPASRL